MASIAEALQDRAALTERLARLTQRAGASASVQEGSEAPESAEELHKSALAVSAEITDLTVKINRANNVAIVEGSGGMSIMECIAERDQMTRDIKIKKDLVTSASSVGFFRDERNSKPTVDIAALNTDIDVMVALRRKLDQRISRANWQNSI